nr:DUF2220 family protein [Candidatus Sigynarchaeota archaeon]
MAWRAQELEDFFKEIRLLTKNRSIETEKLFLILEKHPRLIENNNSRFSMINILNELREMNLVEFFKDKKYFDYTTMPPMPLKVKFIEPAILARETKPWARHTWHPRLAWLAVERSMLHDTYDLLVILDDYVRRLPSAHIPMPEKERSLEIFGDEKALRKIIETFKDKDIFSIANCYQTYEPLVGIPFDSTNETILFIENRDTFMSTCKVISLLDDKPYKAVYYGQGNQFSTAVLSIPVNHGPGTRIEYFGDVDTHGFFIPQDALKALKNMDSSYDIHPQPAMYGRLIELYKKRDIKIECSVATKRRDLDTAWITRLPPDISLDILSILKNKERVPQELLNIIEIYKLFSGTSDIPRELGIDNAEFMKRVKLPKIGSSNPPLLSFVKNER